MDHQDNVVQFPNKPALFNNDLKRQLVQGMQPYTEKPVEAVNTVEDVMCRFIIQGVRDVFTRLGNHLGRKITDGVDAHVR